MSSSFGHSRLRYFFIALGSHRSNRAPIQQPNRLQWPPDSSACEPTRSLARLSMLPPHWESVDEVYSMPFQYVRDDAKRRVTLTLSDPLTVAERIAAMEHQIDDEAWRYGVLIDARALAAYTPQLTEMRDTTSRLAELVAAHGPRGAVAIVSRQSGVIGAGAMHNSLCVNSPVHVFWDMDDARRFLDRLDDS